MRKSHASLEYPVVIKQMKDMVVIACPDLKQTEVLPLPENGRIDPSFVMKVAEKIGQIWLKNHLRLKEIAASDLPCPEPSKIRMSLNERREKPLTAPQLAQIAGVSPDTIRRAIDRGELASELTSGGHRKIPFPVAMQYLEQIGFKLEFL